MGLFASTKNKATAVFEGPADGQPPLQPGPPPLGAFGPGTPNQGPGYATQPLGDGGVPLCYVYPSPHPPHGQYYQPPHIVVNQHYYLAAPGSLAAGGPAILNRLGLGSVANLATEILPVNVPALLGDGLPPWHAPSPCAAVYEKLSATFGLDLTLIDRDQYPGAETGPSPYRPAPAARGADRGRAAEETPRPGKTRGRRKGRAEPGAVTTLIPGNYVAKVDGYANARLPLDLPPMRLYIASYQLLQLAAKYADRAYQQPQGAERFAHIDADWRAGTKAMVIKSVPMDDANTIVFAIRGTASFLDWTVNLNMEPESPAGFLDDPGNLCHAGFLSVARRMVRPVAARLRQLLEEDPGRAAYSLLITGHSAGGAVAALLYAHMLATSSQAASELSLLTGCFRRIHCITFGTPPVSLLPLAKPDRRAWRKSMFFSFVNEGDPVARADKAYVKSLLDLFSRPATAAASPAEHGRRHGGKPVWPVPPATLSNAGRLVVLRSGDPLAALADKKTVGERLAAGVVAQMTTDEQLRGVVWGDPVCHVMKLYARRIEALAKQAVLVDG